MYKLLLFKIYCSPPLQKQLFGLTLMLVGQAISPSESQWCMLMLNSWIWWVPSSTNASLEAIMMPYWDNNSVIQVANNWYNAYWDWLSFHSPSSSTRHYWFAVCFLLVVAADFFNKTHNLARFCFLHGKLMMFSALKSGERSILRFLLITCYFKVVYFLNWLGFAYSYEIAWLGLVFSTKISWKCKTISKSKLLRNVTSNKEEINISYLQLPGSFGTSPDSLPRSNAICPTTEQSRSSLTLCGFPSPSQPQPLQYPSQWNVKQTEQDKLDGIAPQQDQHPIAHPQLKK